MKAIKSAWPIFLCVAIVAGVIGGVLYSNHLGDRKKQSQDNVRAMAKGAFMFSESKMAVFPDSLGGLLADQWVTPEQFLSPWSDKALPEDFDQMPEQDQIEWVNRHSDYVYLLSGRRVRSGDEIIVFELYPPGNFGDVAIATCDDVYSDTPFADRGVARRIPYDEADALIKAQTGYSIIEWREAELPGAGLMTGELVPRPESEHHIPRS